MKDLQKKNSFHHAFRRRPQLFPYGKKQGWQTKQPTKSLVLSAGKILNGPSETTSKTSSFDFTDFYKYGQAEHVAHIPKEFLEWFVGFFEGDGSLSSFATLDKRDGRRGTRLRVEIGQKEKNILQLIQKTFGFGNLRIDRRKNTIYWRWTVDSQQAIERIAFLLSGNLILPKRQKQFLDWIEAGQRKGMFKSFNRFKPWTSKISLQDSWLSGFIDAEGCFYAHYTDPKLPKTKGQLKQKITLTQKDIEGGERKIFQEIIVLFNSKQKIYIFSNLNNPSVFVRIELTALHTQKVMIDYLTKYKLKTIKHISFCKWNFIYKYRQTKIYQSEKTLKKIRRLVSSLNIYSKNLYE
uniref:Putative LAGLIDADG homing endonuclease n=1 Tax=Hazenia capsulata TaxID=2202518 RepID=A0A1W6EHN8_9CHLO|nr:putative LAGLIDADG homing endonuclease [Hazenia capsulata]ARK14893.1 putative LAGLIDADG homing endonuclease [Hazenia capsulata]